WLRRRCASHAFCYDACRCCALQAYVTTTFGTCRLATHAWHSKTCGAETSGCFNRRDDFASPQPLQPDARGPAGATCLAVFVDALVVLRTSAQSGKPELMALGILLLVATA